MISVKIFHCGDIAANCYSVINGNQSVLIDPGYPEQELIKFISDPSITVCAVLLTHRHFDHVNAAGYIKKLTGCKIAVSALDECGLYSDNDSLSALTGFTYGYADKSLKADITLSDGDEINISGFSFKVIATPGHTAGSVCFITDNMLFSGDTLFKNSIGRTDFPTGDYDSMILSLKKIKAFPPDTIVYPGHGDVTVLSRETEQNPYMRDI